ncbi:Uncharacterised protein [Chlamydia trachomatis]|nr:Uncharacterised protein [Chlamydia trachomatis]CRH70985.1 Uncharacterised protein [Chlamydia trachomatis]
MRSTISTQSQDSVPPAPALMDRKQEFRSNSPERSLSVSHSVIFFSQKTNSFSNSFCISKSLEDSSSSKKNCIVETLFFNSLNSDNCCFNRAILSEIFPARATSSQKPSCTACCSNSFNSFSFPSGSKRPPS